MISARSKKSVRYRYLRLKVHSALRLRFYFYFLAFCLLVLGTTAQVSSEQLDPTHLLVAYLVETSQDLDSPNVTVMPLEDMNTPSRAKQTLQDVNGPNDLLQSSWLQPALQELLQIGFNSVEANAVSFTDQFDKETPQGFSTDKPISNSHFEIQLWKTRLGVPKNEKDNRSRAELQRIIEQIYSIEFERINQTTESVIADEPVADAETADITEPDKILSDANTPKEAGKEQVAFKGENALPYGSLTDQTLQMIRSLSQQAEQVNNPFELAEVLFRGGYLKEASVFYQEALNRKNPPEPLSAHEKAWILFQTGNCLRSDDLTKALKMYRQVILECPDSPWTDLAKIQEKLISWHQKEEPRKLVKTLAKRKTF